MAVEEVVEQLRRAHALLSDARTACIAADTAIESGARIFASATRGSIWPQVEKIRDCGHAAAEEVRNAETRFIAAQQIIDGYCQNIAGYRIADLQSSGESAVLESDRVTGYADLVDTAAQYAEWIVELQRDGIDVDPDEVERMERLPDGRIVWLVTGNDDAGMGHILTAGRRAKDFENLGVPQDRIIDLVFAGLGEGRRIGYIGRDRPVYELEFDGRRHRVAVSVGTNGYIAGAMPVPLGRKVRPHLHRR